MRGGAIISDFIVPTRSRLTADYLWPDLKKPSLGKQFSKPLRPEIVDLKGDFEVDFQEFKDESDVDEDDEMVVAKPSSFSAGKPSSARGSGTLVIQSVGLFCFIRN